MIINTQIIIIKYYFYDHGRVNICTISLLSFPSSSLVLVSGLASETMVRSRQNVSTAPSALAALHDLKRECKI